MPKKIKTEKEFGFSKDENFIRVDNIHYFVFLAIIILVLVCACVGGYVYSRDKYHMHKDVAFNSFEYAEKVEDGYNNYQIYLDEENRVYTYYNTPDGVTIEKKWSYGKYLDFNEEMYESGMFNQIFGVEVEIEDYDPEWILDVKLVNGNTVHNSSNFEEEVDKTKFAEVIKKYFDQEIVYK